MVLVCIFTETYSVPGYSLSTSTDITVFPAIWCRGGGVVLSGPIAAGDGEAVLDILTDFPRKRCSSTIISGEADRLTDFEAACLADFNFAESPLDANESGPDISPPMMNLTSSRLTEESPIVTTWFPP